MFRPLFRDGRRSDGMRHGLCGILAFSLCTAGCGGPVDQPVTKEDMTLTKLSDVGELYRFYTQEKKKPPKSEADFAPLGMMSPMGLNAIRTGEIVVRFGAALPDTGEEPGKGPGDEVLAYEKQVPATGGKVLMLNRTVRAMTAEEFKAAKLAGTTSSDSAQEKGKEKKAKKG